LFQHIHNDHPDFTEQWKYYQDGKSWLLKVTRKATTVFWLSIENGSFRTTFYFTDKGAQALAKSTISGELKEQYKTGRRFGKIRGVTVSFKNKRDVEDARQLIGIKLSLV
jgi:hypothetical protein